MKKIEKLNINLAADGTYAGSKEDAILQDKINECIKVINLIHGHIEPGDLPVHVDWCGLDPDEHNDEERVLILADDQEDKFIEQNLELYMKLVKLIVDASPFVITCNTCDERFLIYSIIRPTNGVGDERIEEMNAGYCPHCGSKFQSIILKKTSGRVKNRRRK